MEIKVEVTLVVQYPLNTQKKKNQAVRGSNTYNEPIPQSPHEAAPSEDVPRPKGQAEQALRPVSLVKKSRLQSEHFVSPATSLNSPGIHGKQKDWSFSL